MNWYQIFYWITVADNVKSFFDFSSNLFTFISVIGFLIFLLCLAIRTFADDFDDEGKLTFITFISNIRKATFWFTILALITWSGYIFIPSKKDALVIVAGGAVGNFITSDSSAKQIPSEVAYLLREKIREEIKEVKTTTITDTLEAKSKEELIQMLKTKQ